MCTSQIAAWVNENARKYDDQKPENNGGKTEYYDLPLPEISGLTSILFAHKGGNIDIDVAVESILALFPTTLNDLIEYKNMKPWQHEVFKATYALEDRAKKNPEAGSSITREINKIIYYAERGKNLVKYPAN